MHCNWQFIYSYQKAVHFTASHQDLRIHAVTTNLMQWVSKSPPTPQHSSAGVSFMWIQLEYLVVTAQPGKSHKTHGQPTVKFCIMSLLTEMVGIKIRP